MPIIKATNLACPLDGLPLSHADKCYTCGNGHSFDEARQGYVNLLPVQHKASRNPGDSKEMVVARSGFLNTGLYEPVAKKISGMLTNLLDTNGQSDRCLVDAGCGEGYYLDYIINNLSASETETSLSCIGIDISKAAIIAATKRNTRICWLVASNKLIPLLPASVDVIICMFGFPSYESFQTILKPGGRIILVDAGPLHLIELRERIYPIIKEVKDYDSSKLEQNGFVIQREDTLHYEARLDSNETIMQLMAMTPHLYRASREGIARIKTLQAISVTVDVVYRILARG